MTETPLREVRRAVYRPVREGNALEDTVARLVQTIRLGVVAPGESLPAERDLAARYAVSRDTVREAIRELADTGYLVRRRGRYGGTFVADPLPQPPDPGRIDVAHLEDVLGLRRVLEAGAARAAASRSLDAAQRDELWARYEAVAAGSEADYRRRDTLLHLAIAEVAGIPSLVALAAENRAQVNAWLDTFPLLPRNIEHANAQHEHIVTAILAGRADAAEHAVLDHLAGTEALLRGFLT
ncbi:GntR family transcriptional regulator [Microbacterium sp. Root166]|uniref:FadR/GntR family transcriptional regulator n=1 Tax=Microbacterium sp. Root166 TaxID=1736478 RepID=UPI0006F9DDF3|nr:GntR family transcriptional regulator [Microbacterium sp. Root166]KQZ85796.1 GntR family transcriptional regulator [Microbacterium sp. Root166]